MMVRIYWWILKKLFKNLGKVGNEEIYRSGQPGFIRRRIMYWIIRPNTRINLAYSPDYDGQDYPEKKFLEGQGVACYNYTWSAGGPIDKMEEVTEVAELLSTAPRPIWIGCEGGKDRTGGAIGYWRKQRGDSLTDIIEDFRRHKVPSEGWLEVVF